jgi:hypothetical protein
MKIKHTLSIPTAPAKEDTLPNLIIVTTMVSTQESLLGPLNCGYNVYRDVEKKVRAVEVMCLNEMVAILNVLASSYRLYTRML